MKLCRLCGEVITENEASIGFGQGDGNDFVHAWCYEEYIVLMNAMIATHYRAKKILIQILDVHKTLIRQREQELKS